MKKLRNPVRGHNRSRLLANSAAAGVPRLILTALSFALCASAAEYQLHLEPGSTQVTWTLGDVLHTVHGTFQLRHGDIVLDRKSVV